MLAAAERYLQRSELLRDPDARLVLTGLARLVLRSAGEGVRGVGESAEGERGSAQQQPAARGAPVLGGPRLSRGFVPLRVGEAVTHVPVSGTSEEIYAARVSSEYGDEPARPARASSHSALTVDPVEVAGVIARRCAIKVEACEVAMARQADPGLGREGADALIARAKALPNCFLWMFMPGHEVPAREVLEMIRGCYENLRSSAVLMGDVLGGSVVGKRLTQRIAELAARSQSALRAALRRTWMERSDYDQDDMFLLLRRFAEQEQVFIERHMRVDDPADPALWNQTAGELTEVSVEVEAEQQKGRESRKFLNKARHHAKRILHDKESSEATDWESVFGVAGCAARVGGGGARAAGADRVVEGGGVRARAEVRGLARRGVGQGRWRRGRAVGRLGASGRSAGGAGSGEVGWAAGGVVRRHGIGAPAGADSAGLCVGGTGVGDAA
jgi:hypothetical protein